MNKRFAIFYLLVLVSMMLAACGVPPAPTPGPVSTKAPVSETPAPTTQVCDDACMETMINKAVAEALAKQLAADSQAAAGNVTSQPVVEPTTASVVVIVPSPTSAQTCASPRLLAETDLYQGLVVLVMQFNEQEAQRLAAPTNMDVFSHFWNGSLSAIKKADEAPSAMKFEAWGFPSNCMDESQWAAAHPGIPEVEYMNVLMLSATP